MWSGWDVLLIALLTFVAMVVLQIATPVVGRFGFAYPHQTWLEVAQKPILLLISQFIIYAAVAACMIMLVEGKYHLPFWQTIRWKWPRAGGWKLPGAGRTHDLLGLLQSLSAHA